MSAPEKELPTKLYVCTGCDWEGEAYPDPEVCPRCGDAVWEATEDDDPSD